MVTHNIFQTRGLPDRIALMHKGRITEIKEKDDFLKILTKK